MKKTLCTLIITFVISSLCTSCYRSRCEMWEDTKTCGRYMGKGIGSLFGRHEDAREYVNYLEAWEEETEFVSLSDNNSYESLTMGDYNTSAPPARESPGDPGSRVPGIKGFSTPKGKLADLLGNIHFDTDNYSVSGSESISTLRTISDYLSSHPRTCLFIEGHADERGAAAYNLALGSRRANAIRIFLVQNGSHPDQVFTISYGKERPFALGHDESSWQKNRRGQFKVYER